MRMARDAQIADLSLGLQLLVFVEDAVFLSVIHILDAPKRMNIKQINVVGLESFEGKLKFLLK